MDITASLVPVFQNMKTRNDGTECVENQSAHSILPLPHTALIHHHTTNQRVQWLDSQTSLMLHVESEQTTHIWFQRLPTQLNTWNRFVPRTSSESPKTLQSSNSWAGVFLHLETLRSSAFCLWLSRVWIWRHPWPVHQLYPPQLL